MFCDAAIQACLTLRAPLGLPLRPVTGMVASLLVLAGVDWPVTDYSTLSRRRKGLLVAISHRPGTGALHLLIDSTGIKAEGNGEWCAKKHGPSKQRRSLPGRRMLAFAGRGRKVHLGIDAETLKIRAIEIIGAGVGDAPMLPGLLDQIPASQRIGKVTADGAYDTRGCHAAIAARDACAVIPARKNARLWLENTPGAQARNDSVLATRRLDRMIWRRWSGYHRRSLVETKMRCFKLLGERVMARDFDSQVAELQIRAAILNRFTALGTPQTQRVG